MWEERTSIACSSIEDTQGVILTYLKVVDRLDCKAYVNRKRASTIFCFDGGPSSFAEAANRPTCSTSSSISHSPGVSDE